MVPNAAIETYIENLLFLLKDNIFGKVKHILLLSKINARTFTQILSENNFRSLNVQSDFQELTTTAMKR